MSALTKAPRFITTTQLAEQMGVHPDTVRRMLEKGHVAGAKRTPGGHWRIPSKTADTLAKAHGGAARS